MATTKTVETHQLDLIGNFAAEAAKVAAAQVKMGEQARATGAMMSSGMKTAQAGVKSLGVEVLAMAGWAGGAYAVATGIREIVSATSEAETATVKFNTALTNSGENTAENRAEIEAWALAVMNTHGIGDELAATLVALGAGMKLNTQQSREYAEVAADMAVRAGTVQGNFEALARGADGDTRALAGLARQFNINVTEGSSFAEVLQQIKDATGGNAAAQVHTLAGEWKLFKDNLGNAAEWNSVGAAIKSLIGLVNDYANERRLATASVATMERQDLEFQRAQLQQRLSEIGHENAQEPTQEQGLVDSSTLVRHRQYEETLNRILDISKRLGELNRQDAAGKTPTINTQGGVAGFTGPIVDQAELDKNATAATKLAEANRKVAEEAAKAAKEQAALYDAARAVPPTTTTAEDVDALRSAWANFSPVMTTVAGDTSEATAALEKLHEEARTEPIKTTTAADMDALFTAARETPVVTTVASTKLIDEEKRAADESKRIWKEAYEDSIEGVGDVLAAAITGGDVTGAIENTLGGLLERTISDSVANALTASFGASTASAFGSLAGSIAGALTTVVFDAFDTSAHTEGGKLREELNDILADAGFNSGSSNPFGGGDTSQLTAAELEATGMADLWQKWSEDIVGSDLIGQGGEILAGAFDGLNLSVTETIGVMGRLIAAGQGLTDAEGRQTAAATALLSMTEMSVAELSDVALAYGSASYYITRENELREQLLEQAQSYYDKFGATGGDMSSAEFAAMEATRAEYIGLLATEAATQAKSDDDLLRALEEQGMSEEDANDLVSSQKDSNQIAAEQLTELEKIAINTGSAAVLTTPSTPITPPVTPDRYSASFSDSWSRAAVVGADRDRGRNQSVYNVTVNGLVGGARDVATTVRDEIYALDRARDRGNRR